MKKKRGLPEFRSSPIGCRPERRIRETTPDSQYYYTELIGSIQLQFDNSVRQRRVVGFGGFHPVDLAHVSPALAKLHFRLAFNELLGHRLHLAFSILEP